MVFDLTAITDGESSVHHHCGEVCASLMSFLVRIPTTGAIEVPKILQILAGGQTDSKLRRSAERSESNQEN